jgi:DNA-binding transcriptional ArsR family regulator
VIDRLGRLAREAPFRRQYRDVLRTAWETYRPLWESEGRAAVSEAAADLERRIRESGSPVEPLPPDSIVRSPRFAPVIRAAERDGRIVISPVFAAWGRAGGHLFDLPGIVVFGVPVLASSSVEERRRHAEAIAASLKVLSDGTRVALLSSLASRPASVTDLAEEFDLAQPTVSVHVGKLRGAGLLESRRENGRTVYSTSSERVEHLLDDARTLLLRYCET